MSTPHLPRARRFASALLGVASALLVAPTAFALNQPEEPAPWQESQVAPPTNFSTEAITPFVLDAQSSMRLGIDPKTLTIDPDGVVRYVLVAKSSQGALNVLYEGIRCASAEVKVYARWDNASSWNTSGKAEWEPLAFRGATRRAMQMARGGVCEGKVPNGTPARILRALQSGNTELPR